MSLVTQQAANRPGRVSATQMPRSGTRSMGTPNHQQSTESVPPIQQARLYPEPISEDITFLRLPQVKATTGLSKTTIYEEIKENAFPCPVLISKRAVAWIESEVKQWAASQVSSARAVMPRIPPKRVAFSRPRLPIAKTA